MNRVVFEEVNKVVLIHEGVVDSHHASLRRVGAEGRSAYKAANSTESVDSNASY